MKKYFKSIRLVPIIVSLILPIAIGLGGCTTVNAPATETPTAPEAATITTAAILVGPEIPQEVLSLWKSDPASLASPASIQDKITLKPNTASGSTQVSENMSLRVIPAGTRKDSTSFHLEEGQWVDVIVSSVDIPIYFNWEEAGAISLGAECWTVYDPNIYKLLAVNFDHSAHYLKYSISYYGLAPATSPSLGEGEAPARLPVSADVNLAPYDKGRTEQFHNPKYLAATEGCIHAGPAISLSQGDTVRLTLESDCPIDWYGDWDNPKPQIGILFPQMRTYTEDSGWVTICSEAIDAKSIVSSNGGRKLEIVLTPLENKGRSGVLIQKAQVVGQPPEREMSVFQPLYYKVLYENHIASTSTGTVFTTAGRMFASQGATEYWFTFTNWNSQKNADITYHVYKLDITPGWGKDFKEQKLQPWLNDLYNMLVSKQISQEEYDQAESRWLEQFR